MESYAYRGDQMERRSRAAIRGFLVVLGVLATATGTISPRHVSAQESATELEVPGASSSDSLLNEAFEESISQYMAEYDVSYETAAERLHDQAVGSDLLFRIGSDPLVVAASLRHGREAVEVVVLTAPAVGTERLASSIEGVAALVGLDYRVETVEAVGSKSQLDAARKEIQEQLDQQDSLGWEVYLDGYTGELNVNIDSAEPEVRAQAQRIVDEAFARQEMVSLVPDVGVVRIEERNQAGGGERLTIGGANCTSGYAVRDQWGPAIMTAGHCGNSNVDLIDTSGAGGTSTVVDLDNATQDGYWFGRDSQFHRLTDDGVADPAIVTNSGNQRTVIRQTLSVGQGDWICQFGRTTNAQMCGTVINSDHVSSSAGGPTLDNMILTSADIRGGDSGGPVFSGDRAIGITSRGRDCKLYDAGGDCLIHNETVLTRIGNSLSGTGYSLLAPADSGRFQTVGPSRVYDSRDPGSYPVWGGSARAIQVRGVGGVPNSPLVTAVVLNVTTIGPSGGGYVTVYPGGSQRPPVASGNYGAGSVIAHNTTVALDDTNDDVVIYSSQTVDIAVDVVGFYRMDGVGSKTTLFNNPIRALDTRNVGGASVPIGHRSWRDVTLPVQVPDTATGVIVNVTGLANTAGTFVTVQHPWASLPPTTSSLNLNSPYMVMANQAVSAVLDIGSRSQLRVWNENGSTHVIVDVLGYFHPSGDQLYAPLQPTRMIDSRYNVGTVGALGPGETRVIQIAGLSSHPLIPENASGVNLSVAGVSPTASEYLTVSRWGSTGTSTINLAAGVDRSNAVSVALDGDYVRVYNSAGYTHLVIDAEGYFYDD